MSASPAPERGAAAIAGVPRVASNSACLPAPRKRGVELRLHSAPPKARNHTSTERSTCTTSAVWKKSTHGKIFCTYGARASTSSTEKTPETRSEASPSNSHLRARLRRASLGIGSEKSEEVIYIF